MMRCAIRNCGRPARWLLSDDADDTRPSCGHHVALVVGWVLEDQPTLPSVIIEPIQAKPHAQVCWSCLTCSAGRCSCTARAATSAGSAARPAGQDPLEVVDVEQDDPLFDQGYVYDRIPAWVPPDVPGAERSQR